MEAMILILMAMALVACKAAILVQMLFWSNETKAVISVRKSG